MRVQIVKGAGLFKLPREMGWFIKGRNQAAPRAVDVGREHAWLRKRLVRVCRDRCSVKIHVETMDTIPRFVVMVDVVISKFVVMKAVHDMTVMAANWFVGGLPSQIVSSGEFYHWFS